MVGKGRRMALGFVVGALATALLGSATARADRLTLGSPSLGSLTPLDFGTLACSSTDTCTAYQDPGSAGQRARWTSPVNGLITSWSMRVDDSANSDQTGADARFQLRVIRVDSDTAYFVAKRSAGSLTPRFFSPGIYTMPAAVPIAPGEQITLGGVPNAEMPIFLAATSAPSVRITSSDNPGDGQVGVAFNTTNFGLLGINATVTYCRVPDVKGKKLKKAKKLVRAADCDPAPKRKGEAKKRKKRKRIRRQDPAPGSTALPGTDVKLVYKR